jgi:hypothetical protein
LFRLSHASACGVVAGEGSRRRSLMVGSFNQEARNSGKDQQDSWDDNLELRQIPQIRAEFRVKLDSASAICDDRC